MAATILRDSDPFAAAINRRFREHAREAAADRFRLAVAISQLAKDYDDTTSDGAARIVANMHKRETWQQGPDETFVAYMSRIETRELHDVFIRRRAAGMPAWPADDEPFDSIIVTP